MQKKKNKSCDNVRNYYRKEGKEEAFVSLHNK